MSFQYDDAAFRAMFPEFADSTKYPAPMISLYWDLATTFISVSGCPCNMLSGKQLTAALNYMTAHLLTLALRQANETNPEDGTGGIELSASIDKVSVTMMAPPADNMWRFWLAQTPYGQALLALLAMVSVGGFSVGGLPERTAYRKVFGTFR